MNEKRYAITATSREKAKEILRGAMVGANLAPRSYNGVEPARPVELLPDDIMYGILQETLTQNANDLDACAKVKVAVFDPENSTSDKIASKTSELEFTVYSYLLNYSQSINSGKRVAFKWCSFLNRYEIFGENC